MRAGYDLPYFAERMQVRGFAQAVDEMGFAHLAFSEHGAATAYPPGFARDDPWHQSATLAAFLSAVTARIELNPSMLAGDAAPVALAAKQLAEVDLLSGGRLRSTAASPSSTRVRPAWARAPGAGVGSG